MRFSLILAVLLCAGPIRADEFFASIRKIEDGAITVAKTGGGKKKGKGRGPYVSFPLSETVKITAAKYKRKTQSFQVGILLAGGLDHPVFRDLSGGLLARVVTADKRVVEINVILNEGDATTVIAVRPKRPPTKQKP